VSEKGEPPPMLLLTYRAPLLLTHRPQQTSRSK